MVKAEDVERLLPLNFGIRAMGDALAPKELALRVEHELGRYDPLDAAKATALARERAGQATALHAIVEMCEAVVAEYEETKAGFDPRSEGPAASAYLERLGRSKTGSAHQPRSSTASDRFPRSRESFARVARALCDELRKAPATRALTPAELHPLHNIVKAPWGAEVSGVTRRGGGGQDSISERRESQHEDALPCPKPSPIQRRTPAEGEVGELRTPRASGVQRSGSKRSGSG